MTPPPVPEPPALRLLHVPSRVRAAVLLLPGGRAESMRPPTRLDLPSRRMVPFGRAVCRDLPGDVLLTALVRYRYRGWNGPRADPVRDARRALGELAALAPHLAVTLVGHSMGGRAALAVAGHPRVRGVVALAPWCVPGDPVRQLADRNLVVLHDPRDRTTSAAQSFAFARRAAGIGACVQTLPMRHGGHTMVRDAATWHRFTADAVASVLTGVPLLPQRPED